MTPTEGDVERFREAVAHRLGLHVEDARLPWLGEVLRARLSATGLAGAEYLARLGAGAERDEIAALGRELTVAETYFFRNHEQFLALGEAVLPERMRARGADRRLRLLSAGCATGEEAYSLAIVCRERIADPSWEVSIRAVDVNPDALARAARARYAPWALRETPEEARSRWFSGAGRDLALDDGLRGAVRFEERNLSQDDPDLWQPAGYDVVFCRNLIMYFTPDGARALVGRIARALAPGGFLFLGHAETLRGVSHDFHLVHTHGAFYYRRKDRIGAGEHPGPAGAGAPAVAAPLAAALRDAGTWVEVIAAAAERIRGLHDAAARTPDGSPASAPEAGAPAPAPAPPPKAGAPAPRWDLGRPLELLRDERFAEALDAVGALPAEAAGDPDVLLLRAVLLAHGGRPRDAEQACRRLLDTDDLSAGAHYVLALCREQAGDRAAAAEHDRVAAYLDPGFAMPHLHLGLLAGRADDRDTARRELSRAIELLRGEDASRLLLFGGGFSRDALIALCRAGLQSEART